MQPMLKKQLKIQMPDGSPYSAPNESIAPNVSSEMASNVFAPTDGQSAALAAFDATGGALVIAGYAGTGKTTMLKLIAAKYGRPLVLTPTGKAALRVSQASGLPAQTIHRWMYTPLENPRTGKLEFVFKNRDLEIPSSRLVVVDESSMLGRQLWTDLQRQCALHRLRIVLVGDAFQLPPVEDKGSKDFSTMTPEFAAENNFARVELTEVLRQVAGSPVIQASMRLRAGEGSAALEHLPRVHVAQLGDCAIATYQSNGVIITHTNAARFRVNHGIRQQLGGVDAQARGPQPGEPLLCLANNYDLDLWNGEQVTFGGWESDSHINGHARLVSDRYSGAEQDIRYGIALVGGKRAILALEELTGDVGKLGRSALGYGARRWASDVGARGDDGEPLPFLSASYGYCYTAHKSQGSQWPYVLYICEPSIKLNTIEGRRHAYTAVTRSEQMTACYFGRV